MPEGVVEIEDKVWTCILRPYRKYVHKWDKSYRIAFSMADFSAVMLFML